MSEMENIVIKDSLDGLGTDAYGDYLAHALCLAGTCRLKYNGEERELQAGDLMIVRKGKLVERIRPAADFRVKVIYVTSGFIELSTPLSNYGMKGQLSLFLNPVMRLDEGQRELCRKDFEMVESRFAQTDHHFRKDLLIASVQMLFRNAGPFDICWKYGDIWMVLRKFVLSTIFFAQTTKSVHDGLCGMAALVIFDIIVSMEARPGMNCLSGIKR